MSVKVGVVGLGFMGRTHLDAYRAASVRGFSNELVAVCDADPARRAGKPGGAGNLESGEREELMFDPAAVRAYESPEQLFADPEVELVSICTHTDSHVDLAIAALAAGKHVLVEKPLAMNEQELARIEAFYQGGGPAPVLLTGFNRRFSKHMQPLLQLAAKRTNPFIANYRMNAGHIPSDHWVHGTEGGGRNIGEACHIYDLFTALAGGTVQAVDSMAITPNGGHFRRDDNFVATFEFEDGSVASLTYTALGHKEHPKERLELYVDGMVGEMDDYRRADVTGIFGRGTQSATQDKGQKEELVAFADAIQGKSEWPIPLWQQLQAMRMAFAVQRGLDGKGSG